MTARLLEVQAHLPRNHDNPEFDDLWDTEEESDDSAHAENSGYNSADRDDHNASNQDERNGLTSTKCPHPRCRHKRHFLNRTGLERHFESRTRFGWSI